MTKAKPAKELVMGERYTDRYSGVSGAAMEIIACLNGCYLVSLDRGLDKDDGEHLKRETTFDTYLDDGDGKPTRCPEAIAARAAEVMGKKYRDTVSGIVGVATSVRFLLNGTEQLGIHPQSSDPTKMPEGWSIDSHQCEEIVPPQPVAAASRIGGPPQRAPRV